MRGSLQEPEAPTAATHNNHLISKELSSARHHQTPLTEFPMKKCSLSKQRSTVTCRTPQCALNDLVDSLKSATKTLDSIYENLTSTEPEGSLTAERPGGNPLRCVRVRSHPKFNPTARPVADHRPIYRCGHLGAVAWRELESVGSAGEIQKAAENLRSPIQQERFYPTFQFSDNAEPLPIIEKILKVVPAEAQGWSLLSWFEAQNTLLDQRKPVRDSHRQSVGSPQRGDSVLFA
jgi:hypothetical protein